MLTRLLALTLLFAGIDGSPWELSGYGVTASRPADRVTLRVPVDGPSQSLPVVAAVTPLCHSEASYAPEVSSAIEAFLPAWSWYRMCAVAWCESRFDPGATNGPHVGVWQINRKLWGHLGFDLRDIDQATQAAAQILKVQGIGAWTCARWN